MYAMPTLAPAPAPAFAPATALAPSPPPTPAIAPGALNQLLALGAAMDFLLTLGVHSDDDCVDALALNSCLGCC